MGRLTLMHDSGGRTAGAPRTRRDAGNGRHRAPIVLIVEDDGSTLSLLRDVAVDAGWEPHGFTHLADFRAAYARTARPDLVILDDDLPDGRGGDLARELRADPRMRDVPVVVCTAAHPMRVAEITGWAPVIQKPFDLDQLESFLDAAARHGRREDGWAAG
jgi:DNA-binding response OmpR family regulator